jgi:hypothetical protein
MIDKMHEKYVNKCKIYAKLYTKNVTLVFIHIHFNFSNFSHSL